MSISFICVLVGLPVIVFAVLFYTGIIKINEPYKKSDGMDVVITWVTSDEKFEKEKNLWLLKDQKKLTLDNKNNKRYIDNQEIKYTLRSVEKNFPCYSRIFLVVKDGQFPNYLKRDHKSLIVINHSQIIPKKYLPTFNSMAIEPFIHNIPDLSENYIYLNDDVMFLKHTDCSYFLDSDGKPQPLFCMKKYLHKYENVNLENYNFRKGYMFNNYLLDKICRPEPDGRYLTPHTPKIFNKTYDTEIIKRLKKYYVNENKHNIYESTVMSKFRKNSNLYLVSLLKDYLYHYWFDRKFKPTDVAYIDIFDEKPPMPLNTQFLCIQEVDKNHEDEYVEFMNTIFPNKSSFEI